MMVFGSAWIQKEIKIILIFYLKIERSNFKLKYNILVTGGTGFIGKHFILELLKKKNLRFFLYQKKKLKKTFKSKT